MNTKIKLLVAGVATVAVVGGAAATGLAYAKPSDPTPTPGATPSQSPTPGQKNQGRKHEGGLLGRALHGEATVKGGKQAGGETRVIVFQRGTVTAINPTSVELKSEDGYAATYVIDGQIRVRTGREPGQLGDVKVDQKVRLLATKDGSTLTVKRIIIVP